MMARSARARDVSELRREVRDLRRLLARLIHAVYTHTRTDIAPDAALPAMRRMLAEARGGRRGKR